MLVLLLILQSFPAKAEWWPSCSPRSEELRFDCHPDKNATPEGCQARQCCWTNPLSSAFNRAPACYFPPNYPGFTVEETALRPDRTEYILHRKEATTFIYPAIDRLEMHFIKIGPNILRVKIEDAAARRFEVPFVLESIDLYTGDVLFEHEMVPGTRENEVIGFKIRRRTPDRTLIFDSSVAPLIYSDQFIQISTRLPSQYVYGLGEHRTQFQISANWRKMSFWTRDQATVRDDNLYGNHPFLMSIDQNGQAFGYFMLNSNAMETKFTPMPAVTYRTIGGIIDMFFFFGPSPEDVISQYWSLVGNPLMAPYWSLGYHLSRWHYGTLDNLKAIVAKMKELEFPYDVQWTDIDALDEKRIFTYDRVNWAGLPEFIDELHRENKKYMSINDPGIACSPSIVGYGTYERGLEAEVFIKWANDSGYLVGEVWPGLTVYPDWTHPNAVGWWADELVRWNRTVPVDGLWIDMNEVSSFVYGSVDGCNMPIDNPAFIPEILEDSLWAKTVCPSARQTTSIQYNMHSLYGLTWAMATYQGLLQVHPGERPFILTRASFSGSAKHTSKWGGDNFATFNDMYYSIPDILNFNLFGFAQTGDDLCGFIFDTTEELCTRWHQVGAFYTFMRNHNNDESKPHDPTAFDPEYRDIMKEMVIMHYRLLPLLYTSLYQATKNSKMVFTSLMFEYPDDVQAHSIDAQFFVGGALMVAPVLIDQVRQVNVYFPWKKNQRWYEFPSGRHVSTANEGTWRVFDAPLDKVHIFMRSGSIIPTHIIANESKNAMENRGSHFRVYAALGDDANGEMSGLLFWDDGLSLLSADSYSVISFKGHDGIISFSTSKHGYTASSLILDEVVVFGVTKNVQSVALNNRYHDDYNYDSGSDCLTVRNLNVDINGPLQQIVTWQYP